MLRRNAGTKNANSQRHVFSVKGQNGTTTVSLELKFLLELNFFTKPWRTNASQSVLFKFVYRKREVSREVKEEEGEVVENLKTKMYIQ